EHPLRRRNTGQWAIDGIWSVWLQSGGFHENHVHPHGWISSACYIQLPDGVDDADTKSGWLKLGEPMMPTEPELEVEHWVKPEVGHLVLFPSYMWHGTAPFSASQPRLSVALDIVPA
ncbi:MAG: 2OG-Fe(II) oxygenase family protein, partial [Firmicutes bacterium]|nr:2OG-Fe(II) oxygenase family protein [Bacillota bacterium]